MVKVRKDLTGMTFGRLTVLEQSEDYIDKNGIHYARWKCLCNCDKHNIVEVMGKCLTRKNNPTRSCGCIHSETLSNANIKRRKHNNYSDMLSDDNGNYYIGYCSNTGNEFYIDADDYNLIKNYYWCECISEVGYHSVMTCIQKSMIKIHQLLGYKGCDHIDRNPLNNRRYNLRVATVQENNRNASIQKNNTSGIIGVGWHKVSQKWIAYIIINKKQKHLGIFSHKEDAIKTRLSAEIKYFGEFAPQRHLFEQYGIEVTNDDQKIIS